MYFLILNDEIVYIGSSRDIESRIENHCRHAPRGRPKKTFTSAVWIELRSCDLKAYEGALIRALRPRYNESAPVHLDRDNEVLIRLGLTPHIDERVAAIEFAIARRAAVRTRRSAA